MKTAKGYRKEFPEVRKQYFIEHEEKCQKCNSTNLIELNHIVALQDGGTNDFDNLSPLCNKCHKQWHNDCEQVMSYTEFLDYPTPAEQQWLTMLQRKEECRDMTASDRRTAEMVIKTFSRDMAHDLEERK